MESKAAVLALAALAQDTRLAVFRRLVQAGPDGLAVGAIAAAVPASPATLSFHLKELSRVGLITARPEGRFIYYVAVFPRMNALLDFLTATCCDGDPARCFPKSAPKRIQSRSTPSLTVGAGRGPRRP